MKKRVMVVDDSRVVAVRMEKFLEGSEFEVAAYCENGEDAIARYGEIQPDVITIDIIMPGIDGLETAQVIAEEHPEARIIMLSSLTDQEGNSAEDLSGSKLFLHKPLTREELLEGLRSALK